MRRISENGFGILANHWHVFRRPFVVELEKVTIITPAAITLHNWLHNDASSRKIYVPPGLVDSENSQTGVVIPGSWRFGCPFKFRELVRTF